MYRYLRCISLLTSMMLNLGLRLKQTGRWKRIWSRRINNNRRTSNCARKIHYVCVLPTGVCKWVCGRACVFVCRCVLACVCVYMHVCKRMCLYLRLCVCVYVHVCACARMCMCVFIYVRGEVLKISCLWVKEDTGASLHTFCSQIRPLFTAGI